MLRICKYIVLTVGTGWRSFHFISKEHNQSKKKISFSSWTNIVAKPIKNHSKQLDFDGFPGYYSTLTSSSSVMAASWKTNKISRTSRIGRSLHFCSLFGICVTANQPKWGENTHRFAYFSDPRCEPPYL